VSILLARQILDFHEQIVRQANGAIRRHVVPQRFYIPDSQGRIGA
jgi:hypothetical protein